MSWEISTFQVLHSSPTGSPACKAAKKDLDIFENAAIPLSMLNAFLFVLIWSYIRYPPKFDAKSDEDGGELGAFKIEGRGVDEQQQLQQDDQTNDRSNGTQTINEEVQRQIAAIKELPNPKEDTEQASREEINDAIDTFEPTADDADVLPQPQASSNEAASLFAPFTFFLSRETPRQPLEFILRAFGCKRVGWDAVLGDGAFTNNESDPSITHQVVDRPPLASLPEEPTPANGEESSSTQVVKAGHRMPGRIYIQPQWVWDCINEMQLIPPHLYAPGAELPP